MERRKSKVPSILRLEGMSIILMIFVLSVTEYYRENTGDLSPSLYPWEIIFKCRNDV